MFFFFFFFFQSRHIKLTTLAEGGDASNIKPTVLYDLDPLHPSGARVRLDEEGVLHWPVMFLYPEYAQTDFIQSFCENHRSAV